MAQKTPEKQILPIAPPYPDLNNLTRWAGDLVRTLQQNLATIARKANDAPYTGNGSPEGVVTAPVGSLFSRLDGGAGTTLYVKESGTGNTGWVAK